MNLARYKEQVVETFFLGIILTTGFACATIYFLNFYFAVPIGRSVMIGLFIALISTVIFTTWIHRQITSPLLTLINVIRHVSAGDDSVPAPDISRLTIGREAVQAAAASVTELASSKQTVNKKYLAEHEYMQALLAESPLPLIVLDSENRVRYLNTSSVKLVKSSVENPIGEDINTVFAIAYSSDQTLDDWLKESREAKVRESRVWDRVRIEVDGRAHVFDMVTSFNKNESHGIETIVMLFDHTNQYRADDSQISFVSLAVHELRAPITVLKGYVEAFEEELGPTLNDEQKEFMEKMNVSAAQLSTFVNNILSVVKVDSDEMKVHLAKENWVETINSSAVEFATRARLRGRQIKVSVPEQLPEVAADKVSIYEVLSNLVDNAIKYSNDGGEIIITTQEKDGMIETTVQDFGIGIPANLTDHLFEKFYRSHRSRENVGGTGLGLYLSKAIVEAHGGTIWVSSQEGKGSTFGFTLPTYASLADKLQGEEAQDGTIVRSAHGWIKNHSMVRK